MDIELQKKIEYEKGFIEGFKAGELITHNYYRCPDDCASMNCTNCFR